MEVQIISQSCVQPSLPTPPHLKTYKVSLIDQFVKSNYFAAIFFYQNCQQTNKDTQKRSSLLKQSLSETLTRFYPFAGKVKDTLTIDCNDEGVYYIEAKANISLSQYLLGQRELDLASLNKLKPDVCLEFDLPCGSHIALIQETTFACGGFSIAIYISHMIGDGATIFFLMRDWAASARNLPVQHPFLKGGEAEFIQFSSVCGMGFYEVDFGWGKPIWATYALPNMNALDLPSTNSVLFIGTRGKGIEAYITIKEYVFDFLKKDPEVLQYASICHAPKLLASL